MSNERFVLSSGDTSYIISVELEGNDVPYIGLTLNTKSLALGHVLNDSKVFTDSESIRELGHFLIEMADAYDNIPTGMYKEYVHKMTYSVIGDDSDTGDSDV